MMTNWLFQKARFGFNEYFLTDDSSGLTISLYKDDQKWDKPKDGEPIDKGKLVYQVYIISIDDIAYYVCW